MLFMASVGTNFSLAFGRDIRKMLICKILVNKNIVSSSKCSGNVSCGLRNTDSATLLVRMYPALSSVGIFGCHASSHVYFMVF